ncbi:hypothetical protein [Brevundimonas sp.]|uniref:hypothetical protein n=1 Tax=Brevundimonas sp. TaxID=1871086 RepID=UPI00289E685A|nr:hypothetical protein [Brevundimonas sp.]
MIYLTNEQLSHAHHLDQYRWAMNGNEANDSYFRHEATEMHMLLVIDAVSDLLFKAVQVGQAQGGGVHDHLVYGVARRAGDIRLAMREIVQTSPVGRTKPMVSEEVDVASRALNTIYINIRGSLDNLAWAVIEKNGGLQKAGLNPAEVDLFGRKFRKIEAWKTLTEALSDMADWTQELARLRNPAAHQIPLAVVPAAMGEKDAAEFQRLHALLLAPLPEGPFDADTFRKKREETADIKRQMATLGEYIGDFAHRPKEGLNPIYPTVPNDVGQMVRAARIVLPVLAE